MKDITPEKLSELKNLYVKLIVYNFPNFLESRIQLFLNTNISCGREILLKASAHIYDSFTDEDTWDFVETYRDFATRYEYNTPISIELRRNIINFLEGKKNTDYNTSSSWMVNVFWNVIPIALILILTSIREVVLYLIKNKNCLWWIPFGGILIKMVLVFLTAPTSYFMYYFSTYVVGGVLIVMWVIDNIKKKRMGSKIEQVERGVKTNSEY